MYDTEYVAMTYSKRVHNYLGTSEGMSHVIDLNTDVSGS
jgi:hypothetical protein